MDERRAGFVDFIFNSSLQLLYAHIVNYVYIERMT